MEQGRLAARHAFGEGGSFNSNLFPYGIYTIPETSMVGRTEKELSEAGIPYEIGVARYREIARGQIIGDPNGLVKLLIHADDRTILGVHLLGTGASELVHIGQTAMALGGTLDFFVDNVFNYPTLAECYKVGARSKRITYSLRFWSNSDALWSVIASSLVTRLELVDLGLDGSHARHVAVPGLSHILKLSF